MNYRHIEKITRGRSLPLMREDSNGDPMIISKGSADGINFFKIEIPQDNGYTRKLYIYEDGTSEELYE